MQMKTMQMKTMQMKYSGSEAERQRETELKAWLWHGGRSRVGGMGLAPGRTQTDPRSP